MKYFISSDGKECLGPFSRADLDQKILDEEVGRMTLLWHKGMEGWKPIETVQEFIFF